MNTTIIIFLVLFLQGCGDRGVDIEKKVLAFDPSFQNAINVRNSLAEEISARQISYNEKEADFVERINVLNAKKETAKREYFASVEEIKRRLDPRKRSLRQELIDIERRYRNQKTELEYIDRDIKEISALIDKKDRLILTPEEIRSWNERLAVLIDKRSDITSKKEELKQEIEITKLKIKVLEI